jgi:hypothetical protein
VGLRVRQATRQEKHPYKNELFVSYCFLINIREASCQVSVKLSLRLTKHDTMKMYGGVEVQLHALNGGDWSVSGPGAITPGKESPVPL